MGDFTPPSYKILGYASPNQNFLSLVSKLNALLLFQNGLGIFILNKWSLKKNLKIAVKFNYKMIKPIKLSNSIMKLNY